MNAEAARLFQFAEHKLAEAEKILQIDIFEAAGRDAYFAALAAARAVIANAGIKTPKTHDGTRTVFAKMIHDGLAFDHQLGKFLADGYEIKSAADYGEGAPVGREDAEEALRTAHQFLSAIRKILI